MIIKTSISFLLNIIAFKKGALFLTSSVASVGAVFYLNEMMRGTETRYIVIPIFSLMIGFCFFFSFVLVDLVTGLWKAKYLNETSKKPQKSYIKSYKLYKTLWKMLGVFLLQMMITFVCIFAEIMDAEYIYAFTLWAMVTIWIMACGFEFHSIGENIQERTGTKPEIFDFLDKALNLFQKKALAKVENVFGEDKSEPPVEQEPQINKDEKEQ